MDRTKQEWQRKIQSTHPSPPGRDCCHLLLTELTKYFQSQDDSEGYIVFFVLFCFVSFCSFFFKQPLPTLACSTQHPKDRQSPINSMTQARIKVANSPKESGGCRVCHLAAFYCFLCVKLPSMCPQPMRPTSSSSSWPFTNAKLAR